MGARRVAVLIALVMCVSFLSASPQLMLSAAAADVDKGDNIAKIIHDACATAPFASLCVETLTAAAVEANKTALTDDTPAAGLALMAAARNGANTSAFISKMLDKADAPAVQQQCFSDCSKIYIDAVEQVEDSMAALDSADYGDVKMWVSAAVADTQTCGEMCKGSSGDATEELFRRNTEFSNLCSNALAIVNDVAP